MDLEHLRSIERRRIVVPPKAMRLNRLEKVNPWPDEFVEMVRSGVTSDSIAFYPDYVNFYQRAAKFFSVGTGQLVAGLGIEDHIRAILWLYCRPDDRVAYLWPTCAMFDVYSDVFRLRATRVVPTPRSPLSVHGLVSKLPDDLRVLILANPGQPVETEFSRNAVAQIVEACAARGALCVVDEAYYGFGTETCLPLIYDFDNLIVLRTLSKAFGGAGLRVGFALGQRDVIRPLDAVRLSGELPAFSMHAATVLMDNAAQFVLPSVDAVRDGVDWLMRQVPRLGFRAFGGRSNHILIDFCSPYRAEAIARHLEIRGILVKGGFPPPLSTYVMVTCGPRAYMEMFFDELKVVADAVA